jgi:hypothetical protein
MESSVTARVDAVPHTYDTGLGLAGAAQPASDVPENDMLQTYSCRCRVTGEGHPFGSHVERMRP